MSGGELRAKLVITGDAKGVVGAAAETETALDGVNAKAKTTGTTLTNTNAKFDAGAVAMKGQADAAKSAEAALTKTGAARKAEISALSAQAAAGDAMIGKVRALSAAHADYNSTIAAARAGLAAKAITEAEYTTIAGAATAKLAANLATARAEATATGMALDRLEVNLAKLGRVGGVSRGVISRIRAGLAAIPEVVSAFPMVSAAGAAAVAIGVLTAAEQSYEASIGRLNVTLQTHGLALSTSNEKYLALAGNISAAGNVSTRTAREMEAAFADAHIDSSMWTSISAMAKDYAAVLQTDVATAAAKWADGLEQPYNLACQLTEQYGLLDQATLTHIRDLEESGRVTEAQALVTDRWSERIKNAADQTAGWARAWSWVKTNVGGAWDAIGEALFSSKAAKLKIEIADLEAELEKSRKGIKTLVHDANTDTLYLRAPLPVRDVEANLKAKRSQLMELDGTREANNIEANDARLLGEQYDPQKAALRKNANERNKITNWFNNGSIDLATKNELLLGNTKAYIDILMQGNAVETEHTKTLETGAAAAKRSADAIREMADAYEDIVKAGKDATRDLGARFLALSGPFAVAKKAAEDWRDGHIAALKAAGLYTKEAAAKIAAVFRDDMRRALDDNLRNRTDWASGVKRANIDLIQSQQDWANTSEGFIKGWDNEGENAFVKFATTGKASIADLTNFVEQQIARMGYQRYVAGTMNSIGNALLDGIEGVLGIGGGSSILSGLFHTGGEVGEASASRTVPLFAFYGAPRAHRGGKILGTDEVPIIAKRREVVLTEDQQESSDRTLEAWSRALQSQSVTQLPSGMFTATVAGQAPKIEIHNHGEAIGTVTQQYDPDTNTSRIDIKRDVGKAVATAVSSGAADSALAKRFGASPTLIRRA